MSEHDKLDGSSKLINQKRGKVMSKYTDFRFTSGQIDDQLANKTIPSKS
jgi:cellulase/cellobiase CelA1